jgi:hypothetical protein
MLPEVAYIMPPHKLNNPRHKKLDEAEKMIQKLRSDSRQRLAVAIHEAGHGIVAEQLGMPAWYDGSAIEHVKESDEWIVSFGRTQVPIGCYLRLNVEQMARFAAAGVAAETVLLGSEPSPTADSDFESFIQSSKCPPSESIGIYKAVQEQMLNEWRNDLETQRRIVHEGAVFERQVWPELAVKTEPPRFKN